MPVEELLPKAKAVNVEAQLQLAEEYYEGDHNCGRGELAGPPQDFKAAFYWFLQAANKDNAEAQFKLGIMYTNGQGVAANEKEAHLWFSKTAPNGHKQSMWLIQNTGFQYSARKTPNCTS